jgi:RNA polymerase sigma factor (sigma-70 family)
MCSFFYFELVLCLENLENIYRMFSSMVFNLALHYTRNIQDAEEITQDVFLKIHEKGHAFRGESELKTWIYRITINRSLDVLKNKKSKKNTPWQFSIQPDLFPGGTFKTDENPHKTLENKQQLNSLIQCIHQLPPDQRDVIVLLKMEGCSQKETAGILNRSPKAIESLFHRAKQALKACWQKTNEK